MNLEALGRTYHGGAPAPLQPGDLVTAADAPEGAPTWVGAVELATNHVPPLYRVNQMGNGSFFMNPWEIRLLTDAEAVGLAEAVCMSQWAREEGIDALSTPDGTPILRCYGGEWWTAGIGCGPLISHGQCNDSMSGKASASRALIAYTIRGQP